MSCLARSPTASPEAREYELAANMVGEELLPQTTILPLVDLVITHGGNNTTTEALPFGKPMIVVPLFWDQYDNAQRVDESGFGVRLDTYRFTDKQMYTLWTVFLATRRSIIGYRQWRPRRRPAR